MIPRLNPHYVFKPLLWFALCVPLGTYAQITFILKQLPIQTPQDAEFYLAASFNQWNPKSPDHKFKFHADGTYRLKVAEVAPPFEFKVTQGNWETSEADANGKAIDNRVVGDVGAARLVILNVAGWIGQPQAEAIDTLHFIVERIPENTPPEAQLYIAGTFNSWQTGLEAFRLHDQGDGTFAISLPVYRDTVQYKFTRGIWSTVEGRESGRDRFNRKLYVKEHGGGPVRITIQSWEDLAGTPINGYTVFWLMAAIQGILILIAINTLENNRLSANRWLSFLLLIMSSALIGRVVVYDREVFNWGPKLILLPDLIYFLYAPLFIQYISNLLRTAPANPNPKRWLHFLPFGLHFLAYLPLLLMEESEFIYRAINLELRPVFIVTGALALFYNIIYWLYARRIIRAYQYDSDHTYSGGSNLTFLNTVLVLKGVCLILWALAYGIGAYGAMLDLDVMFITDRTMDALWIGFSLTAFLLGYFAMKEPEIFKLPGDDLSSTPESAPEALPTNSQAAESKAIPDEDQEWLATREKLIRIMENEQPYLNPKLTLPELADISAET
ncbi:MAG: hypothetical protein AAF804_16040, partial [Bacteroidota bacterium]